MNNQSLLTLAKLPPANPSSFAVLDAYPRYTLTLIGHDYPGQTPAMWNAVYRQFDFKVAAAMLVGQLPDLPEIVALLKADSKYIGGGVGVGFKDQIIDLLDQLDPLAAAIGAVNLIEKLPDGQLKGWNTDGLGYTDSLSEVCQARGWHLAGLRVVILGAGGTGNAIAFALAEYGAELTIINRTTAKAVALSDRINRYAKKAISVGVGEEALRKELPLAQVVLNVSTKGAVGELAAYSALAPAILPATAENIHQNLVEAEALFAATPKTAIVSDVVLSAKPTPFLATAKRLGFTTLDGVPMVINQGAAAFKIIHGRELGPADHNLVRQVMKQTAST